MTILLWILAHIVGAVFGIILAGALFWWAMAAIQAAVARAFKRADWMPVWVSSSGKRHRDPL